MIDPACFSAFASELKKQASDTDPLTGEVELKKVRGLHGIRHRGPRLTQTPLRQPFSGNWTKRAEFNPAHALLGAGSVVGGAALAHKALKTPMDQPKELPSAHLARNAKTWLQTPGAPLRDVLR
jgi:hypothetical protein